MDKDLKTLQTLLVENGFAVARQKRHVVYKNAHGKIWVVPFTPSDHHAYRNNLEQFRRFLAIGVAKAGNTTPVTERERREAERRLHPEREKLRREIKARRIVQKKLKPAPSIPLAKVERIVRESRPAIKAIDNYATNRFLEKFFIASVGQCWYLSSKTTLILKGEECYNTVVAMHADGKSRPEIEAVEKIHQEKAMRWAAYAKKRLPPILKALRTLTIRACKTKQTRETHSEQMREAIYKIFSRDAKPHEKFQFTVDYVAPLIWALVDQHHSPDTKMVETLKAAIDTMNEVNKILDGKIAASLGRADLEKENLISRINKDAPPTVTHVPGASGTRGLPNNPPEFNPTRRNTLILD